MNAPRSCRVAVAALVVALASASFAQAQNTRWSPDRPSQQPASGVVQAQATTQAGMHSSAVRRTNYQSASPSWQRSPNQTSTPHQSQTLTRRPSSSGSYAGSQQATYSSSAPQFTASAGSRRASSASYNDQKFLSDYNIRLADGEKLVGPPKIVEGGPLGGAPANTPAPNATRGEMLPTPDAGISGGMLMQNGMPHEGETIYEGGMPPDGEIHLDPGMEYENGVVYGHGDCTSCTDGGPCLQDEWCDPPACPECGLYGHHRLGCGQVARCLYNCLGFLFKEASVFAGTQSFKGPLDLGVNGNFGFNEGFNLAGSLVPFPRYGLGYQVGARWTQSDLSGSVFGSSAREQVFVTAGVFHRAYRGCGLQWGVVYDWLTDNYYTKSTIAQVRGEISLINARGHELGFAGVFGTQNDEVTFNIFNIAVVNQPVAPTDMYTMFYRHTTKYGGQGRLWGGFTDQNLPIVGADFRVPMSNRCDLVGGFNYVMPDAGQNNNGFQDESWNLGMNIVFYFGRPKQGIHNTPYRPLFNVADNGTVMLRRQ